MYKNNNLSFLMKSLNIKTLHVSAHQSALSTVPHAAFVKIIAKNSLLLKAPIGKRDHIL
jgi:hypothetical protein